ncbi:MAG: hypothetical protein Q8P52_02160 [bacterium]|nr:hypothetical protein [bacterium]
MIQDSRKNRPELVEGRFLIFRNQVSEILKLPNHTAFKPLNTCGLGTFEVGFGQPADGSFVIHTCWNKCQVDNDRVAYRSRVHIRGLTSRNMSEKFVGIGTTEND